MAACEFGTDSGRISVRPRGFDEDAAHMRVAGFGDPVTRGARPGGVLGGDETDEAHELRGGGEPSPVAHLTANPSALSGSMPR